MSGEFLWCGKVMVYGTMMITEAEVSMTSTVFSYSVLICGLTSVLSNIQSVAAEKTAVYVFSSYSVPEDVTNFQLP